VTALELVLAVAVVLLTAAMVVGFVFAVRSCASSASTPVSTPRSAA